MTIRIKRITVLFLAAVFITGLFVLMMPKVSYGDAAVDPGDYSTEPAKNNDNSTSSSDNNPLPAEKNDDSASSSGNTKKPAENNNDSAQATDNTAENNTHSEPSANNTAPSAESKNYSPPANNTAPAKNYNNSAPAANYTPEPTDITDVDYNVEVKASDGVNFRSGAGGGYGIIQGILIPNGTVLHISRVATAANGALWGYTEYKGKKGWIYLELTKKVKKVGKKSGKTAKKTVVPSDSTTVNYNVEVRAPRGGLYIRSGPGVKFDKLQTRMIPNGTVLHISRIIITKNGKKDFWIWKALRIFRIHRAKNGAHWGYTRYNGQKGWIYLRKTTDTTAAVTNAAPTQTKPKEESATDTDSSVTEDSEDQPESDVITVPDSSRTNSDMYFMLNILIMAIIGLVILILIVIIVILLTRRK